MIDEMTGDKFWCAVRGDGSLPIVSARQTDVGMIRRISELVDSLNTPLQINPDGTTKWIIGTTRKGKCKNVITKQQLDEAVDGRAELYKCSFERKRKHMYVNVNTSIRKLKYNSFASILNEFDIYGSVVLMPRKRIY